MFKERHGFLKINYFHLGVSILIIRAISVKYNQYSRWLPGFQASLIVQLKSLHVKPHPLKPIFVPLLTYPDVDITIGTHATEAGAGDK